MFGQLVVLPVPADLTGEITTLEPAAERPGLVMAEPVGWQSVETEETFATDFADMFVQILSSVFGHEMVLKLKML